MYVFMHVDAANRAECNLTNKFELVTLYAQPLGPDFAVSFLYVIVAYINK